MNAMKLFWAMSVICLCGCATIEIQTLDAKPIPNERVYLTELVRKDDALAHIVFKRDSGVFGSGTSLHLYVNDKKVADIAPGERLDVYLMPGRNILALEDWLGLSGRQGVAVSANAGETQVYRVSASLSGLQIIPAVN